MSEKIKAVPNVDEGTKPLTNEQLLAAIQESSRLNQMLLDEAKKRDLLKNPITPEWEAKLEVIKARAVEIDDCQHCIDHAKERVQCNEELTELYKSLGAAHTRTCPTCNGKTGAGADKLHKIVFKTEEAKEKYRTANRNRQAAEKRLASGK